jgi:hypothetical protein
MGAFLFEWSGRALGGAGTSQTVRAAVAWSEVPQICLAIVFLAILLGTGVWQAIVPSMPDPNGASAAGQFTLTRGVEAIISIWSFVVFLHCLGQVHRFSAWRALGAVLMPGAALIAIAVVVKASLT